MRRKALVAVLAAVVVTGPFAPPALAGCHEFRFEQNDYRVSEDERRVRITVSRDAAIAPSSIRYRTVDGTARADEDYLATSGTLTFTTQTEMSFSVRIVDDAADERAEAFRIRLNDPSGCTPNPNFVVDDPATVTIEDDDPAATPTETPTETPTGSPSPTVTPSPADGGVSGGAVAGIVAGVIALLGAAALLMRRRPGT